MSADLGIQLTLDELAKYKHLNTDMLPELMDFYNKNKNKAQKFNKKHSNHKTHDVSTFSPPKNNKNIIPLPIPQRKLPKTDNQQLYSEFRSILNKLTETNFEVLSKDIIALNIATREHLVALANLIFKKAIIDKEFCPIYAKLSRHLAGLNIIEDNKKIFFRDLLVNECQQTFNACISYDPTNKDVTGINDITKERATGCIRFIGDIYNHDLLTNKIVNSCFLLLLMKINNPNGYIIDCISDLLKTSGKLFMSRCPKETELIFQKIELAVKSGKLSNKDRFALMDMIDLKKANKF
ncbi:MAG: MIF4G domain-containing protein [Nitrososphaeraceae archaeon]|nr:MIF4G domain-containing protein [Nitrososphaeraceae archaeon]